ncbi:hypothetical protein LINGRAHAP2_LOCUS29876 [Linum grandiflorum]
MPTISNLAAIPEPLKSKIDSIRDRWSQPQLIIAKRLTAADIKKEKLLIPSSQILTGNFLTEAEHIELTAPASNDYHVFNERTVVAMLVDPSLSTCTVAMKLVNSGRDYLITANWSLVLKRNRGALFQGALVRLWCFRRCGELWLAVEAVEEDTAMEETASEEEAAKEAIFMKAGKMAYEYLEWRNKWRKEMEERHRWTSEFCDRLRDFEE